MKLWSKEALILGGIFGVLSTPFTYSDNTFIEKFSIGLFWLFFFCALLLCFNKTPRFISWILNRYPRVSYYLISIGWIPYFVIVFLFTAFIVGFFIKYSDDMIDKQFLILSYITEFGLPFSLMIAFAKKHFYKKS